MEDFIKELQFLPKINFMSLNNTDAIYASTTKIQDSEDTEADR